MGKIVGTIGKLLTIVYTIFLIYVLMNHNIHQTGKDDVELLTKAKDDTLNFLRFSKLTMFRGNIMSVITSVASLLLTLLIVAATGNPFCKFMLYPTTVLVHFAIFILQISPDALPIGQYLPSLSAIVTNPSNTIVNFFVTIMNSVGKVYPSMKSYFDLWQTEILNINIPIVLLILVAYGLLNKKLQFHTRIIVPLVIVLISAVRVTTAYAEETSIVIAVQLSLIAGWALISFFNGMVIMDTILLFPFYFIGIIFTSQSVVDFIKEMTVGQRLMGVWYDVMFIIIYMLLFCMIFYKKIGGALLPAFLLFIAFGMFFNTRLGFEYLVPIFFITRLFSDN